LTFGFQFNSFQQETTNNSSTFYTANNAQMMNNTTVVEEPKFTPKQEKQNTNQGVEMPVAPQQIASSHFENKQSSITAMQEQKNDNKESVNKNAAQNELAGGVDITLMAQIPKGYDVYSIVTLRDVPFYKSEPIYKNQRTIDNAKVLRGLTGGSDAKHQQMVKQQYRLGE
jgi:hypothetical protein